MYDNNNSYTQQSDNTSSSGYQEYYYTAGNNTGSTIDAKPAKKKRKGGFGKKVATSASLGLVFGVIAGAAFSVPAYMSTQELSKLKTEIEALQTADESADETDTTSISTTADAVSASNTSYTESGDLTVSQIAEMCLPSIVSITNKSVTEVRTMFGTYQQDTESSGSGIIIGENDTELLIVTNYHVVSGSSDLTVIFSYDEDSDDPSAVSAKIKGYDSDKDLAVISVSLDDITDEMRSQISIATIGDSSSLQLGDQVVAIGNALGYGQSVTTGIVSALDREVTVTDDTTGTTVTNKLIQTDAAINPGNSGGALLNMQGELIGINSVKVSDSSVEGMGYAIPISDVRSIIEELMLKETREVVSETAQGYLGIGGTDVTSEISETYDMPVGIYVNTVYEDSPAAAAGISKGNIITKFDGQTVKSMSELKSLMTYYKAGETVEVIAMVQSTDGYTEQTYTVTLGTQDIFGDTTTTDDSSSSSDSENGSKEYKSDPFSSFWPLN